jgi:tRNA modification GTPase
LFDGSQPLDDLDKELIKLTKDKNHIKVINKTDLGLKIEIEGVKISTYTKDIDNLLKAIKDKVGYNYENYQNKPMLTNIRHIGLLKAALENLKEAEKEIQEDIPVDLVNIEIMNALNNIEDILGNKTKMDLHDQIFSKFCLGK